MMEKIVDSEIKIRDFKSKIVKKKTLLGIELECKSTNNYGNEIVVNFIKNKKTVKTEKIEIPFLVGDGIFCVGKAFDFIDYDEIKVDLELGIVLYQESYYPQTQFEFDKEKSNEKHLEYKIENKSNDTFKFASLSLLFYNRGELVCGTDVKIENVLSQRPYYFTYDIPKEIEYTDIKTELILPATNKYLFRSFYKEYLDHEFLISTLQDPIKRRPHEKFTDNSDELKESLADVKAERKSVNRIKTKKQILPVFLLKSLLYLPLSVAIGFGVSLVLFILLKLLFAIEANDLTLYILWGISSIISFVVKWFKKWDTFDNYVTVEEKEKELKEYDDLIKQLEDAIKDLSENKENYIKKYEEKNKEIDEYNKEMDELDKKREKNLASALKTFEVFKADYPEYRVIEKYDDVDMGFVEAAISQGAITWDSVEMYRKEARKEYDEDVKFQKELEELRRKNELIAAQNEAIRKNTEQQMLDARAMREQVAENARRHDSLVMQQIAQNEKLYRQRENYANQVTTKIDELRYQEYINDRYPSYWKQ